MLKEGVYKTTKFLPLPLFTPVPFPSSIPFPFFPLPFSFSSFLALSPSLLDSYPNNLPCELYQLYFQSILQVAELREELEKRGLDTKGTKPFLVERLKVVFQFFRVIVLLIKGQN